MSCTSRLKTLFLLKCLMPLLHSADGLQQFKKPGAIYHQILTSLKPPPVKPTPGYFKPCKFCVFSFYFIQQF